MNTTRIISIAIALAGLSAAASAQQLPGNPGQYAIDFKGQRSLAEVQAEARLVPTTRAMEPAGSRVAPVLKSSLDRAKLRQETAQAVRSGRIDFGDAPRI